MGRYERAYGSDWDTLDEEAAMERAYALGVAASLGEYHPDELDAIRGEVATSYDKSIVDLAFEEGKSEAREVDFDDGEDGGVWETLVESETVTAPDEEVPTGGRTGLPGAIDKFEALDLPEPNRNEALERPDFLEKD